MEFRGDFTDSCIFHSVERLMIVVDTSAPGLVIPDIAVNNLTILKSLEINEYDFHDNNVRISNLTKLTTLTELCGTITNIVPTDLIEIARMSQLTHLDFDDNEVSVDLAREIALHPNLKMFATLSDIVDNEVKLFLANGQLTDLTAPNLIGCGEFFEAVMNNKMISNLRCKVPEAYKEMLVRYEGIVNLVMDEIVVLKEEDDEELSDE
jgi:hypothetical protein